MVTIVGKCSAVNGNGWEKVSLIELVKRNECEGKEID
jgi:hypothetical protein